MPKTIEQSIHYTFKNKAWLNTLFQHQEPSIRERQRLEFLGDALLSSQISYLLIEQFKDANEGQLTRMRAHLVNAKALGQLARSLDFHTMIQSPTPMNDKTLSMALEILLAMVFLDGGQSALNQTIHALFDPLIQTLEPDTSGSDPKSELQAYCQSIGIERPHYALVKEEGPKHQLVITITASLNDQSLSVTHKGPNRKTAEQTCAKHLLTILHMRANHA